MVGEMVLELSMFELGDSVVVNNTACSIDEHRLSTRRCGGK